MFDALNILLLGAYICGTTITAFPTTKYHIYKRPAYRKIFSSAGGLYVNRQPYKVSSKDNTLIASRNYNTRN